MLLSNWTLDGSEVEIPHVWGDGVDLRWEGPAVYSTTFAANAPGWLVFHGVSAHARVFIDGALHAEHLGIWDAFSVRVESPGEHRVEVEVIKNGGETIPVASIASGFLPFVFGTFGGIYKSVEWIEQEKDPLAPLPSARLRAKLVGHKLLVDSSPVYLRGLLHWGWYPQLRHPNPPRELCAKEIESAKAMGFNCIKYCLWVPPHHYFEELEKAGMFAWLELPIWNPGENLAQFEEELTRIVLQNRQHKSIILWTIGCELGHQMTRDARKRLFDIVKVLTGGALIKDSSGGAEMYGGDPVEFGDFEDFHPYCDLKDYPAVLDQLQAGPRRNRAILLGECNDFDSHRDLPRTVREAPYWASSDPTLNDQGVRLQFDLPKVLATSRFAQDTEAHRRLMAQSLEMKLFVHRTFQEWLRACEFAGSVITGIADTPISTSGFFDDWGDPKFDHEEVRKFMGPDTLFLVPQRKLRWVDGGNKVGMWDAWHVFEGPNRIRIGMHSETGYEGNIEIQIGEKKSTHRIRINPLEQTEIADIDWIAPADSTLRLTASTKETSQAWLIECIAKSEEPLAGEPATVIAAPAFREAAYEFHHPILEDLFVGKPHTLLLSLSNRFFEPTDDVLMTRIDTRSYREHAVVARSGGRLLSTLRTGNDPAGILVQRALAGIAAE